jgi:AraC family transcriptional regulator of arabinose operon
MKSEYLELLNTLTVQFSAAYYRQVRESLTIENFYEVGTTLIKVHSGQISYEQGEKKECIKPGQLLLIPGGKPITLTYGAAPQVTFTYEQFMDSHRQYVSDLPQPLSMSSNTSFTSLHFHTQVLNSVSLLTTLNLFPFIMPPNQNLDTLLQTILAEQLKDNLAKNRVLSIYTELVVIELLRHLASQSWFTDQLVAKQHYFTDTRLLTILNYIHQNLQADLSNSQLAAITHISEDYIGQYFKLLTDVSLQAYEENVRLEEAMKLLKTTTQRIYEISKQVGFRDTAYFCRRFKLKFGIQARKIRPIL